MKKPDNQQNRKRCNRLCLSMAGMALFFVQAAGAHSAECKRVILTGDPDYPPFSWFEKKEFRGSAIEIVTLALKRLNLSYEIRYVGTFPMVLDAARDGRVDMIAELKNTPERHAYLTYSTVPIFSNPVAVFTRADRPLDYHGWNDLLDRQGIVTAGNRFGGGFDEFLSRRLSVRVEDSISDSFAQLANGRGEYYVNSYYPAISYLIRERREADFKVLQPFITTTENFAAWSKASPCAGKRAELDAVLTEMIRSGEVRRILDANFDRLRIAPASVRK